MKYIITFRYTQSGHFPEHFEPGEPITLQEQESAVIPEVGDQVTRTRCKTLYKGLNFG